jgi:hypothetical protein
MEDLIVAFIVCAAVYYVSRKLIPSMRKTKPGCACSMSDRCNSSDNCSGNDE